MAAINLNAGPQERNDRWKDDSDAVFRKKVAIQQFMNSYGPLFRAFATAGKTVSDVVEGEILKEHAELANRLARLIASKVHGKEAAAVSAADLRPFRTEAAEYVASRWVAGRKVDVAAAAAEISAAVDLVDRAWDHDMYRDDRITDDVSLMMSVVAIAGTLTRVVGIYDFRLGRSEVMLRLLTAVVEASVKTAQDMLKDVPATQGDRRNLTQTLARNFTALMEVCYERKAREVTSFLRKRTNDEKRAFFSVRAPLDEAVADFKEWYVCISGWAMMAATEISAPKPVQERGERAVQPPESSKAG